MDRIRQSHGGFYLCGGAFSVDGYELGGLVSSVLAGCTPPAAASTWTFPEIGNLSMVVTYDYDGASRVSASTFCVNGKEFLSGHTVTNYTGGDDAAMVLGSESTFMNVTREIFNATYEKVKTPEGKEVERMVGSTMSQKPASVQETYAYTYAKSQPQGWWLPATTKRTYKDVVGTVDQWTQTTFLAVDPATGFLTAMNVTQQTSTYGGSNTTTALSTTFTYNGKKQLVKMATVAQGQGPVPASSATFQYNRQVSWSHFIDVFTADLIHSCRGVL